MIKQLLIAEGIFALIVGLIIMNNVFFQDKKTDPDTVRYVALGDSYTIGEGASTDEAWPEVLTKHLKDEGIKIELVANPAVTGWTTQDVIERELPVFENSDPTFATLLIGTNDWVRGIDNGTFKNNLNIILDRMQAKLPDKSKIILVTLPDFSKAPNGMMYENSGSIAKGLTEYNDIIKKEGKKRNLKVVDIFPLSQKMENDQTMFASDGLHPSAKGYAKWEQIIFPVARDLLK